MKIKAHIKYEESYVPPKCRKPRYKEKEEYIEVNLREVNFNKLQLAFEDNSYEGKGKIYLYNRKLWYKKPLDGIDVYDDINERWHTSISTPLDYLIWRYENCSKFFRFDYDREKYGMNTSREAVIKLVKDDISQYILVDGEMYERTEEPRYVIISFGLGHNHGGTGMFCDYKYNPSISRDAYFSADEGEKAVQYANKTAADRGDTHDIGKFTPFIKCYIPELIKVNPKKQHGNGSQLLKQYEEIVKASSDATEAGLLCMSLLD